MMFLDIASWCLILLGGFFSVVGGIGIVRFPEFYSRLHGGGITDTLGASLLILGLVLQSPGVLPAAKLLMILFFLLVTSPSSCHALSSSALVQGHQPELDSQLPSRKKSRS
jgi:multicomponent Na+:H+ antiporter subunit G